MINLLIADQNIIIAGIRSLFQVNNEINILEGFEESKSLLEYLHVNKKQEAILLIDVTFQKNIGLSIAKCISKTHKNIKVIIFSQFDDPMTLMFSFRNGAAAFLNKNLSREELIDSLELINKGEFDFFYNKTRESQQ